MFTIYILESISSHRRYIGYTIDMKKRLGEHNEGINISTRNRGPWRVIYKEGGFETRKEAMKREKELKAMKGGVQLTQLLQNYL